MYINTNEACQYLACSRSYLYKLTSSGALTYYKPGGKKNYFSKADLDHWISSVRIASIAEISDRVLGTKEVAYA